MTTPFKSAELGVGGDIVVALAFETFCCSFHLGTNLKFAVSLVSQFFIVGSVTMSWDHVQVQT